MSLKELKTKKASAGTVTANPMLASLTQSQSDMSQFPSAMNASADSAASDASSLPSVADAVQLFKLVDADGDGSLVQDELEPFFNGLGLQISSDDRKTMFESMDENSDGFISMSEFQRWWASAGEDGSSASTLFSRLDEKKQAESLFRLADKRGTGEISRRQFKHLIRRLGSDMSKPRLNEAIAEMDEEQSGVIGFEEFIEWWSTEKHLEKDTERKKKRFLVNLVSTQLFQEFKYRIQEKEALAHHMEALGVDKFAEEMKNKWTTLGVVSALVTGMAYAPLMASMPSEDDISTSEGYVVIALGASFACSVSCVLLSTIFYVHLAFVPPASHVTQSGKVVPGVTEFVEGMSAWDLHSPDAFLVLGILFLLLSVVLRLHLNLYIVVVVSLATQPNWPDIICCPHLN